jgi:hypothetical protein
MSKLVMTRPDSQQLHDAHCRHQAFHMAAPSAGNNAICSGHPRSAFGAFQYFLLLAIVLLH